MQIRLRKQVAAKEEQLKAFPKLQADFKDGLKNITSSKISNIDQYDANKPTYVQLHDLFLKMETDPKIMQDRETAIVAAEETDARMKKDWDVLLEVIRSQVVPEVTKLIKEQKNNPILIQKRKGS